MLEVRSASWFWLKKKCRGAERSADPAVFTRNCRVESAHAQIRASHRSRIWLREGSTRITLFVGYVQGFNMLGKLDESRAPFQKFALGIVACVAVACSSGEAPKSVTRIGACTPSCNASSGGTSGATSGSISGGASGGTSGARTGGTSGGVGGSTSGVTIGGTSGATDAGTSGATNGGTSGGSGGDTSGATSGGTSGGVGGSTLGATHGATSGATDAGAAGTAGSSICPSVECDDGQLCTTGDACRAGTCAGTARTSAVGVVGTAYMFGGGQLSDLIDDTRGLVTFLAPDRLLFADKLDSGTLLTLARVTSGSLLVTAQTITDRDLVWQPLTGWVWQTVPLSHLVAMPDGRFAFFSLQGSQVFRVTSEGKLVEQWRSSDTSSLRMDAVWAGGSIWTCSTSGPSIRYTVAADGSLSGINTPELAGQSCYRLAVAPDESVYASTTQGVMRWAATSGQPITPELILPGVSAIELEVDDTYIALQQAGRMGDFGATEVYRRADLSTVVSFSPIGSDSTLR